MSNREANITGNVRKSARPGRITYVSVDNIDMTLDRDLPRRKRRAKDKTQKKLKVAGMVCAMTVLVAGCVYGGITYYYTNHFFNGTTINGIDVAGMTAYEAEQAIAAAVSEYEINVIARETETQTIKGSDIDYQYASTGEALDILKGQKSYKWIQSLYKNTDYTIDTNATFDRTLLQEQIKTLTCTQSENQIASENAYIAYNNGVFEIVPETQGTEISVKRTYSAIMDAITDGSTSIDLGTETDAYVEAEITSDNEVLLNSLQEYNNISNSTISYTFGDDTVVLNAETFQDWLAFDDKGQLLPEASSFRQSVADYVAQLAEKYDTVGTQRAFTATDGRTVYVTGNAYGWQIDQATETDQLISDILSGNQVSRDPIYSMTANARGYNDLGDTYIEVDMGSQHMFYYQNGSIIFDSDIVSGMLYDSSRATPEGIFTLTSKSSPSVLIGADYQTPVSFWMPFNGGVGFHDATWQPYFGGDRFLSGGSHGCINLPYSAAQELYNIIQYDVPIICFY